MNSVLMILNGVAQIMFALGECYFVVRVLTSRRSRVLSYFALLLAYILASFVALRFLTYLSVVRIFLPSIFLSPVGFIVFREMKRKVYIVTTLPFLLQLVFELSYISIFSGEVTARSYLATWENSTMVFYTVSMLTLLLLLCWPIANYILRNAPSVSDGSWNTITILITGIYAEAALCLHFAAGVENTPVRVMTLLLLAANVLMVGVLAVSLSRASRMRLAEERSLALHRQLQNQVSHYAALTEQLQQNRIIRHDIEKHLFTIRSLLQEGAAEQADQYAARLAAVQRSGPRVGDCENVIADAFLYQWIRETEREGITVRREVVLPHDLAIEPVDLVMAMGNILDNAREAVRDTEEKQIDFSVRMKKNFLVIRASNPRSADEGRKRARHISEMENGTGLQILTRLAEAYNGSLDLQRENTRFNVTLLLENTAPRKTP